MIRFLFKGLLRDRHRSLLPLLVTAIGVMLTVVFHAWITGVIGNSLEFNAKFSAGHVKIMTKSYSENAAQTPNDLAILGTDSLVKSLSARYPRFVFEQRIYFGGIVDIANREGETIAQGNAMGIAVDLLSGSTAEAERLNIPSSMRTGRMPSAGNEALLSREFADKLGISPGDTFTLVSSTMYGELALHNFVMSGTVEFGTTALDRGTVIADLNDVRDALNMQDAAGEILGFFRTGSYIPEEAATVAENFNSENLKADDDFSLVMKSLGMQNNMGFLVEYSGKLNKILVAVFIIAMSLILWNAGLLGGLRRYGEFGMRLAIGEEKGHVYRTMMMESLIIGFFGSLAGTLAGFSIALFLQNHGVDLGMMMKNASIMMPNVFRARITPQTWYVGFIPGFVSAQVGTMLAGIGIYKRQTAQLFKELES